MTADEYKVAIRIQLEDRLTAGLASIGVTVASLIEKTNVLEKSLKSLSRLSKKFNEVGSGAASATAGFSSAQSAAKNYASAMGHVVAQTGLVKAATAQAVASASRLPAVMPYGSGSRIENAGTALAVYGGAIANRNSAMTASGGNGGRREKYMGYAEIVAPPALADRTARLAALGGGGGLANYRNALATYGGGRGGQSRAQRSGWRSRRTFGRGGGNGGGGGGRGGASGPSSGASHGDALIGMGIGAAGFKMLDQMYDKGLEYERRVASLRQMDLNDSQIQDAKKFVKTTNVANTSELDRMRLFTEAQGAFRESGKSDAEALQAAKTMMPVLGNYEVAMSALSGPKHAAAEMAMRSLNKTVEMMGGLGDTKRAQEIADGVFKAVQSSGKMVDERQLKQFFAYGGSATNQQQLRTVFGGLEPIIGELGGSTTAVGLRTAYTRTNGMMALPPKLMLHEMQRLGMADETGKKQNAGLAHLQSTNVLGYAEEIMKRYAAGGITSQTDRERENALLFGTNGSKVMNKVMSQLPVLKESLAAYDKSKSASEVVKDPANKPLMARQAFNKKWENLQLAIAKDGGLLDLATKGLDLLGGAIEKVTNFAKEHPTLVKLAVLGGAALSGLLLVSGGLVLLKLSLSSMKLSMLGAWRGLSGFTSGVWGLGRALLMNPIGLVVLAIAAAIYLLWNNWAEIKSSLLIMWNDLKDVFIKLFNGDISGALKSFAHLFLQGWQMVFNTLIAGVNSILPKAMELSKMTFADDFKKQYMKDPPPAAAANAGQRGPSPYVVPGRSRTVQVNTVLNMDGRQVAAAVTTHQAREANRPGMGASTFDRMMGAPPVGLGQAR